MSILFQENNTLPTSLGVLLQYFLFFLIITKKYNSITIVKKVTAISFGVEAITRTEWMS